MARATAYNFKQIEALRKKITTDPSMWKYYNAVLTGEIFANLVLDVGRLLGGSVAIRVLEESCVSLLGKELTETRLNAFAWRIAANVQRLRHGEVVLPWTAQTEEEWAPVEVLRCWPGLGWKGKSKDDPGSYFQFLVLAGTPVGFSLVRFWSQRQCSYIGIELGFSSRRDRPLLHPAYLVRLRFSALFEPKLSFERPGFHKVRLSPGLAKYNEPLMVDRFSREPGCKPRGYAHGCHVCWLGYGSCPLAVHPLDYVQKICDCCGNPKAWHDPADEALDMCIGCATKVRLKPKET
jgi:hypothetical protein